MKQTHRKVRSGCLMCRRRRVKCDELRPKCSQCQRLLASRGQPVNCTYGTPVQATSQNRSREASPSTMTIAVPSLPSPLSYLSIISQFGWPNPTPPDAKDLLFHLCVVRKDIEPAANRGFLVGINQFSRFLTMAGSFEHLRHCLCSISAGHLKTVTKLSRMVPLESHFRALAIQGMVREMHIMENQSRERQAETVQGLIASSVLLAWYSPNPHEYNSYLKGMRTLLKNTSTDSQASHFVPQQPQDENSSVGLSKSPSQRIQEKYTLLEAVSSSLRSFTKCKLDAELESATRELLNFLHNLRHLSWENLSLEDQLSTVFPIRNWLRFVPRSPDKFASGDHLIYLYLANYETAMLAIATVLPEVDVPLAVEERSSGVAKLRIFIQDAIDARFLQAESVANSLPVYTACMEWLALADKCMEDYNSRSV